MPGPSAAALPARLPRGDSSPLDPDRLALLPYAKYVEVREGDRLRCAAIDLVIGLGGDGKKRVLQKLDAERLDAEIGRWLLQQPGLKGQAFRVDGKTRRDAHVAGQAAPLLLSAILHQEGGVVAQRAIGEKTNEIPEVPRLLAPLPLEDAVVKLDAMHTQAATAIRFGNICQILPALRM
jgi:hypothetical protein